MNLPRAVVAGEMGVRPTGASAHAIRLFPAKSNTLLPMVRRKTSKETQR
jgi:hypothetical protein